MNGPPLPNGRNLVIFINDNFLVDGSLPNGCIFNLTAGQARYPWCDHALVLRTPFQSFSLSCIRSYEDAVLEEDLPALVRYFREYGEGR